MQDQQVVQACLSDAPQKAFAHGIGAFRMNRRFEQRDATGHRHSAETGSLPAVVITDQIRGGLSIGGLLEAVRATQASVGERVTPPWITLRDAQLDEEEGLRAVERTKRSPASRAFIFLLQWRSNKHVHE